jgi:hypothetical protein
MIPQRMSVEMFREKVCDELLTIHKNLEPTKHFTTETLTLETIEKLVAHCGELVTAAKQINGRTVAMDKSGAFSDGALLSPGYNIVEISQVDRFGKEKRKIIHLVAQPSASVATAMNIHYQ